MATKIPFPWGIHSSKGNRAEARARDFSTFDVSITLNDPFLPGRDVADVLGELPHQPVGIGGIGKLEQLLFKQNA